LSVHNNQALLFKLNGQPEKAHAIFDAVLDQYISIFGEHHPSTVNCMVNLATVLKDLQRFDESVKVYEQALEGRKATDGEESS